MENALERRGTTAARRWTAEPQIPKRALAAATRPLVLETASQRDRESKKEPWQRREERGESRRTNKTRASDNRSAPLPLVTLPFSLHPLPLRAETPHQRIVNTRPVYPSALTTAWRRCRRRSSGTCATGNRHCAADPPEKPAGPPLPRACQTKPRQTRRCTHANYRLVSEDRVPASSTSTSASRPLAAAGPGAWKASPSALVRV